MQSTSNLQPSFLNPNAVNEAPFINAGALLSSKEINDLAIKNFANHPDKDNILKHLSEKLISIKYDNCLARGIVPWIFSDGEWEAYDVFRNQTEDLTSHVNSFLETIPGVNTKPYEGQILK